MRIRGRLSEKNIADLANGVEIDGVNYRGAEFVEELGKGGRTNTWYRVLLTEGKNREIRKLIEHFGGAVNRLIRVQYGPFALGELESGALREVPVEQVQRLIEFIAARST